jgi:hypothetical protein
MKTATHTTTESVVDPTAARALAKVREHFPNINRHGINRMSGYDDWNDQKILAAIAALRRCETARSPTINSYAMKHLVERAIGQYLSNGDIICACVFLGFPVKSWEDDYPNVMIGVATRDLRRLAREGATRQK